ncbi:MAG TPA: hypothetical protein VMZ03_11440 [Chitinophagaceae bacterium]|nr:hypothetical protein [Chitinophagaceae bacterium]
MKWVNYFLLSICSTAMVTGVLHITACQQKPSTAGKEYPENIVAITPVNYKKPASGYNDTLVIKGSAAIFFSPDSSQLMKIKGVMGSMQYESDVHDCFFQAKNARAVIHSYWPQVKIMDAKTHRFILFVKNNNSRQVVDLNSKNEMCGLFLFNGTRNPGLADMTNIDTFLEQYFRGQ